MHDHEPNYTLIIKFIEGKASPQEAEQVLAWINDNEENQTLYFRIKDVVDHYAAQQRTVDVGEAWEKVLALAAERNEEQLPSTEGRPSFRFFKYAAIILLMLGSSYLIYRFSQTKPQAPSIVMIEVPLQEPSRVIVLPDSSKVWVKGGGSLKYQSDFMEKERSVWVTGTGFFEIKKIKDDDNNSLPFVVHTRKATVTVLGTSFTVDEAGEKFSVIVNTGLVKTSSNHKAVYLHPSDRLQIEGGSFKKDRVNPGLFSAWKDGDYQFDKTSLKELKEIIETIYDYEVIIKKEERFRNKRITGRITVSDETTLWKALSLMLGAEISRKNQQVIIKPE